MRMTLPDFPDMRTDLLLRHVELDYVVYDPVTDSTAVLNLTAAVLFDLCDGTRTRDQLIEDLARTFSMAKESVSADVEGTLVDFASNGLFLDCA